MPLANIKLNPGLVKDDTSYAAKANWIAAQWIRWRKVSGDVALPETIGGYEIATTDTFDGIARGVHAWTDLTGSRQLAFGTASKLYAFSGGAIIDITPNHSEGVLGPLGPISAKTAAYTVVAADRGVQFDTTGALTLNLTKAATLGKGFVFYVRSLSGTVTIDPTDPEVINGASTYLVTAGNAVKVTTDGASWTATPVSAKNPFETKNGSAVVTVNHVEHGLKQGQNVTFTNTQAVGGLTISGTYPVTSVIDRNTYTITAASNATSDATGGGSADYVAAFVPGQVDGTGGLGFGTGPYGVGPYGLPGTTDSLPLVWSLDNFGEMLVANPRGGGLYLWQPAITYPETLGQGGFVGGTGWTPSATGGTKVAGTASNLSRNAQSQWANLEGYVFRVAVKVAGATAGTLRFQVNAGEVVQVPIDVGPASTQITQNGTYSRLFVMPADARDAVLYADAQFNGTVSDWTITLESKAFLVPEAPRKIDSIFVDPHAVVVALGTYEVDGDYNPTVVRSTDVGNLRAWVPDTDSLATEIILRGGGGRLVAGLPTRQLNLIWGDNGLFRLTWKGEVGNAFESDLIGTGCGLIGRHAAVEMGSSVLWMSNAGNWWIFQNMVPQVIASTLRNDVFDNIAVGQGEKVYAFANTEFTEAWFLYPDSRDGNECSRYVAFNWIEGHWTSGTLSRSAALGAGIFEYPVMLGTPEQDMQGNTGSRIYFHEKGDTANGNILPNFAETGYFDVGDGNTLMQMLGLVFDFILRRGTVRFFIKTKPFPHGPETATGPYPISLTPQVGSYRDQKIDFRRTGRQMAIRIEADDPWRLGTLRPNAKPSGSVR